MKIGKKKIALEQEQTHREKKQRGDVGQECGALGACSRIAMAVARVRAGDGAGRCAAHMLRK